MLSIEQEEALLQRVVASTEPVAVVRSNAHEERRTMSTALARACELASVEGVAAYDLGHSRLTLWANASGPLPGAVAGWHVHLSTTRYVRPQESAARRGFELAEKKE